MHALGFEERSEQGVLILTVAVLVVEDIAGGVRLVAAYAEREADVAKILGDEIVEGFDLVQVVIETLGQFVRFGAYFWGGRPTVFLEACVPAADLLPAYERGQLNVGAVIVGILLFLLVSILLIVFAFR